MLPAHYEQDSIGATLEALHHEIAEPFRALVVYDLDEDPTVAVVREGSGRWPEAEPLKNAHGRGVLGAIRTGLEAARTEYVVVFMADLSDDPRVVNAMVARADQGADVVSASRYMRGGSQVGGPRLKGLLSRMAGSSLHYLTRIPTHDPTNSCRLYRRSYLSEVKIESRGGFEIGLELTVKAYLRGRKVAEVPASWRDRTSGASKFKLARWLPLYLRWYVYTLVRAPFGVRLGRR